MKKAILMLTIALSSGLAFASGSRSGGIQYINSHPALDNVYISVKGNQLNALTIRSSSTATRISVEAKVWWNNDMAKVGGYGHANSMSIIETKDTGKFKRPGLPFDYQNAFEVVSDLKNPAAACVMFKPASSKVQGVCTEIIITVPSYARADQDYNTTQTLDVMDNEIGVFVSNLRQPLPPPPGRAPGTGFIRITPNELYSVRSMLNDTWNSDAEKAQRLEQFVQRKCDGY